jgi:hypothetical protein
MTEQVQVFSADQGQPASSDSQNIQSSAPTPAVQQERMLPQSEVNKIIGRVKDESYQKGLQEHANRTQQNTAPNYESQAPAMQQSYQSVQQQVGGIPQQSPEQIRAMIAEENQKLEYNRNYQGLVNSLVSKVEAGKDKYTDFEQVVKPINFLNTPIWHVAEKFDNPADIVYHLGKNPGKLAQLLTVAYSPELVERGMQEISASLKQNEAAALEKAPNAPLSRQKPSNIGTGNGDSSNLSASDWKKISRI